MQEHPTNGPAAPGRPTPGLMIDGRGRQAIRMWTQRRAEAGLPVAGAWDGPLIALAIALMWNKGVETETQRFRRARGKVLDDRQIAVDLGIGHACVAEFTDRGESQRRTLADGIATALGGGSTGDVILSRVGRQPEGLPATPDALSCRLPSQRSVTA